MATTWDGLPIAEEWPNGASIVVGRDDGAVLLLHRAHQGVDYAGPWGWTTPAGSRQPGEAILPAALRELTEETGLAGIEVAPVDLSGSWVSFAARVGSDAQVTLVDVEHDRFEWVPPEDAYARVRPRFVADGMRRALSVPLDRISFAPESDAVDAVLMADRPIGLARSAPLASDEEYFEAARWATDDGADAVAVHCAIGDPELAGRGIGTRVIWSVVHDIVLPRFPKTRFVVADPLAADGAAVRACQKAGFRRAYDFERESDGHRYALCVFDRSRVSGD
ncbi:GNAT family N-acetyltransferase [Rugosimonospora africana]|uniref:Nudix hydrolase domain-containing protein n=1 Tax=Rugosimonospora africana TaxID=556532 RepID=A0A8J3QNR5_9ACTN|nr:GNAT family N-acetyltransferase [Rugosimonospora africana]GIH12980.1 hypothetical protein Raf01_11520 [Rugosimonospora africana]